MDLVIGLRSNLVESTNSIDDSNNPVGFSIGVKFTRGELLKIGLVLKFTQFLKPIQLTAGGFDQAASNLIRKFDSKKTLNCRLKFLVCSPIRKAF